LRVVLPDELRAGAEEELFSDAFLTELLGVLLPREGVVVVVFTAELREDVVVRVPLLLFSGVRVGVSVLVGVVVRVLFSGTRDGVEAFVERLGSPVCPLFERVLLLFSTALLLYDRPEYWGRLS